MLTVSNALPDGAELIRDIVSESVPGHPILPTGLDVDKSIQAYAHVQGQVQGQGYALEDP